MLNTHALIKEKHIRCNQSPFVIKQLRKTIMTWTLLHNRYRKDESAGNQFAYERLCVKLLRKSKKVFYNNLNVKIIDNRNDIRKFRQTIKLNFTGKTLKDERISLVDRHQVITEEKNIAKKFKQLKLTSHLI